MSCHNFKSVINFYHPIYPLAGVSIPVIASSGAGKVEHFSEVFEKTDVEAALAAGIFHREEVPIEAVKQHMRERGIETR
jgi:glutamine amidotransferase/cyclase